MIGYFLLSIYTGYGQKIATKTVQTPTPIDWGHFANGTIDIIFSSHNDIAWFDTPAETIARRDHTCITPALEMMGQRDDVYFGMENSLYLLEYLDRHPEKLPEIKKFTLNGQFDWGATYNQPYESLLSGEQLVREVYYGAKLVRKMIPGASARVAYNPDVPGRSMQMPQILSKAGIPYLLMSRQREGLYNWKSPDGSSVTAWSSGDYGLIIKEGTLMGNHSDNMVKVKAHIDPLTDDYVKRKIPAHFGFLHSHDYIPPGNYDKQMQEWEVELAKYATLGLPDRFTPPKLEYSSTENFFDKVSANSPSFETITGERPNLWLYIHGPTHHKAISAKREAGVLLPAAETFSTIDAVLSGSFNNYPAYELGIAWKASIYDDHGWGGNNGEVTDLVFRNKLEMARDKGHEILNRALQNITSQIKTDKENSEPVVVFNALSWQRTDPVNVSVKSPGGEFNLVDGKNRTVPYQIVHKTGDGTFEIQFIAENVPSLGYKTYYITKGGSRVANVDLPKTSDTYFENKYYKINLTNGGIKGIYDKQLGKEILETGKFQGGEVFTMQSVGNGAGEFSEVQKPTMEGFDKMSNHSARWKLQKELSGPVSTVFTMRQKLKHSTVEQKLVIYNEIKRIDCKISLLDWDGTLYREFRMALPLNMKNANIAYEVPMGVVEVGKSEITGFAGGGYGSLLYDNVSSEIRPREIQNFITASDDRFGVTMSSSVAVADWVDPTNDPVDNPVLQPILLASRKSCHWEGNEYLQKEDHHFSFSILSHKAGWENGYRFGMQANNPLRAVVQEHTIKNTYLPTEKSFFEIPENQVLISTVKKGEDDNSVVVRLYDIEGKDSQIDLNTFFNIESGEHTNIIEEEGKKIPVSDYSFKTDIGHHAIETFKLIPE